MRISVFVLLLAIISVNLANALTSEETEEVTEICCVHGEAYALAGNKDCEPSDPPENIEVSQTMVCLSVMKSCCQQHFKRKKDCTEGTEFAKDKRCGAPVTDIGKNCCEECSLGRLAGESLGKDGCGSPPVDDLGPETMLRKNAFYQCCVDSVEKTPVAVATEAPTCKPGLCEHVCNIVYGEIDCTCYDGYRLMNDKKSCKDINECAESPDDLCPADGTVCHNTPGSYRCVPIKKREVGGLTCPLGFKPNVKNQVCDDVNECELQSPPCPRDICENTIGGYSCAGEPGRPFPVDGSVPTPETPRPPFSGRTPSVDPRNEMCPPGFRAGPTDDCVDVDECSEHLDDCNRLSQHCINTHGNFFCQDHVSRRCKPGFSANIYTGICEDINECEDNPNLCERDLICVNMAGAYTCKTKSEMTPYKPRTRPPVNRTPPTSPDTCAEGTRMTPDGRCEDINECTEGGHLCDRFQDCVNTHGGHECHCKNGFELDASETCVDIDECALKLDDCPPNTHCLNALGSYICNPKKSPNTTPRVVTTTSPKPTNPGLVPEYEYYYSDEDNSTIDNETKPQIPPASSTTSTTPRPSTTLPPRTTPRRYTPRSTTRRPYTSRPIARPTTTKRPEPLTPKPSVRLTPVEVEARRPKDPFVIEKEKTPEGSYGVDTGEIPKDTWTNVIGINPQPDNRSENPRQSSDRPDTSDNPTDRPQNRPYRPDNNPDRPESRPDPNTERRPYRPGPDSRTDRPLRPEYTPNNRPYRPDSRTDIPPMPELPERPDSTPQNRPRPERPGVRTDVLPKPDYYRPDNRTDRPGQGLSPDARSDKPNTDDQNELLHCLNGYEKNANGDCVDVDECETGRHICGALEACENRPGGYICECKQGYRRNDTSARCVKAQRTVTTIRRTTTTVAPRASTDWSPFGPPEDRNRPTGAWYPPRPTATCEMGYNYDAKQGRCVDIDECSTNKASCSTSEDCVNSPGGYQCVCGSRCHNGLSPTYMTPPKEMGSDPSVITVGSQFGQRGPRYLRPSTTRLPNTGAIVKTCPWGYKLTSEQMCYDIDECAKNATECGPQQRCENFYGGYSCQCPSGHRLVGTNSCEDVDECAYGRPCSYNSKCVNLRGSYRCECESGFRNAAGNERVCVDIDECAERPDLCDHGCANSWGGYRCFCKRGYRLHTDNRTCVDVNECAEWQSVPMRGRLCGGECVNEPGSYRCSCPKGYRLSEEGRNCIDINECELGTASCARGSPDVVCQNTQGGYYCHRINCPRGYKLESKNKCTRIQRSCPVGDWNCLQQPSSYSYNFITFVANMYLPHGSVDLFTMHGPAWIDSVVTFELRMINVDAQNGAKPMDLNCFDMRPMNNICVISLRCSPEGPQVGELELVMSLHQRGQFAGSAVARLVVIVSQYDF